MMTDRAHSSDPKKRVLMISYFFPPIGGIGIAGMQRVIKFLAGMQGSDWYPVVLTVRHDYYEHYFEKDDSYLQRVPSDVTVVRTKVFRALERFLLWRGRVRRRIRGTSPVVSSGNGASYVEPSHTAGSSSFQKFKDLLTSIWQIPDPQIVWLPFALCRGYLDIKSRRIGCIYATGSPWTSLLVGALLKRLTGVPLVLDFRDPWVTNPYRSHFHPFRKRVEALLERFVVRRANIIVANTAELKQEFMERYGELPKGRFHCIYNSLEVSGRRETCVSGACSEGPYPITLVHSGFLYGLRDPRNFLQALSQTLLREPEWRDRVRLELVGTTQLSYSLQALLESLKLDDITKVYGQVSHDSCMEHLRRASVLLLFQPGTGTQIPSKLFEYLPLRKPILAIALPGGATSRFVSNESVGLVADCKDVDDIASKLNLIIRRVASGEASQRESAYDAVLKRYSVETATGFLLQAFSRAIAARPEARWPAAVRKTDSTS